MDYSLAENTSSNSVAGVPTNVDDKTPQAELNQQIPDPQSSPKPIPTQGKLGKYKKLLIIVLIFIFFVAAGFLIMQYLNYQKRNLSRETKMTPAITADFNISAQVQYLSGSSWKLVTDRKIEIKEGDTLVESDVLQTDKNTRMVLSFDDGSVVRVGPETKLTLASLKSALMQISQDRGSIFVRVEKDLQHKFIVNVGNVLVESVGTVFSVENEDEVKVSVFESEVKVKKEENEIQVKENEQWSDGDSEAEEIDNKKLATNEFLNWSLEEENLEKPKSSPTVTQKSVKEDDIDGKITLISDKVDGGIKLVWTASGLDISKGFKVIKNASGSPKYPGDDAVFQGADARSYTWKITDGKTWHFRVCTFTGNGCGIYSNEVTVTAESDGEESSVTGISLTGSKVENIVRLNWNPQGYSEKGYKAVWSKNPGPTYPTRDGDNFVYQSDPSSRSAEIGELESGQTYYFRVCQYLGGTCGIYSNEINLTI